MLRSVAQNLPWINKMHMIVMSESQIPNWINRNTVNIVLHKDFIPSKHLPTFNSTCIEMFLHKIPNLNEYFIYSNDDIYITQLLNKTDFFKDNKPCVLLKQREIKTTVPGDPIRKNSLNIAVPKSHLDNYVYDTQHITIPYIKSYMETLYENNKQVINNSCSKFRETKNLNQYVYVYNQCLNYESYNIGIEPRICTIIDNKHKLYWNRDFSNYKICCLNDSNESTETEMNIVKNKLEKMFPNKCKYEV